MSLIVAVIRATLGLKMTKTDNKGQWRIKDFPFGNGSNLFGHENT